MIKDIYIIKNKFNKKVYIGQTVNPKQRWAQYKSSAIKEPNKQLIIKAMSKYGFDNFWMEILESRIENYDEREKYWIKEYNSITPNGYNVADGGQGIGNGIYSTSASIKNEDKLLEVIDDIIQGVLSFKEIAKKYDLSYGVVSEINQGHTYYNPDLKYPLRDSNRYSQEKLKQITYSLKYELDKSLVAIAKEYDCDRSFLNDINQGRAYFREYLDYPLRLGKMKYQEQYLPLLIEDLKNTNIPQKDLAKKYNISAQTVCEINKGKKGKQPDIEYPIRTEQMQGRSCFSPNEIELIYTELRETNKSIKQIAKDFGTKLNVISNINNGKTKKYHNPDIIYPIRKK